MKSSTKKNGDKPKPVFTKRYFTGSGVLEVAVWSNTSGEGEEEREVYSATLRKTFKRDGEFEESASLFPQELPLAAFALQEAASFIFTQMNK